MIHAIGWGLLAFLAAEMSLIMLGTTVLWASQGDGLDEEAERERAIAKLVLVTSALIGLAVACLSY